MMKLRIFVLPLLLRLAYADLPFPDFMFFPADSRVGNVQQLPLEALAAQYDSKSALIVGGTDGIGRGIAMTLARSGACVTVVGHSPTKAAETLGNLTAVARHPGKQRFFAYAVDLLTVRGTLNFSKQLLGSGSRFDYAVLTVGVWPDREQPMTDDGIDKVIAADVLARFLVTREILPSLNDGARVMSVLGSTVRFSLPEVSVIKDLALGKRVRYSISEMLGTAGVLGDTWMQCMSTYHPGNVTFIGTFPGIVATNLIETSKTFPKWLRPWLARAQKLVAMSPEKSGLIHATILSSPNAVMRPVSYFNVKLEGRRTNPLAYDDSFQHWVWSFLEDTVTRHNRSVSTQIML